MISSTFLHIQDALTQSDIQTLLSISKEHLNEEEMPCYSLLYKQDHPLVEKITGIIKEHTSSQPYFLNDFYIYTDPSFKTDWHIDTELFSFAHALNAWILLSPDEVTSPLRVLPGLNDGPDNFFHSIQIKEGTATFRNFSTRKRHTQSLESIEEQSEASPDVKLGDILLFNPGMFHRTNNRVTPKHCLALKYVFEGHNRFRTEQQVPKMFWPEVEIFNNALGSMENWQDVLDSLGEALKDEKSRELLNAGGFPEQIPLYKEKIAPLV